MGKRTIDIEDILGWTYRAQLADIVIERGYGLHPIERQVDGIPVFRVSADGVVACMRSGALGTQAIGGTAGIKADLNPDAERVHSTVMMLGGDDTLLIIRHAKAGTRPDWLANARHRFEPDWKARRRYDEATGLPVRGSYNVITVWDTSRNMQSTYCPVSEYDGPGHVEARRAVYAKWHRALVTLARHFGDALLDEHIVTGPLVGAKPWSARDTELSSKNSGVVFTELRRRLYTAHR